jgi:hypothetical protein
LGWLYFVSSPIDNPQQPVEGYFDMRYWILLATWWRRDGTPVPDRKLLSGVQNGDPLAIAFLGTIIVVVVGSALYKFFHKH